MIRLAAAAFVAATLASGAVLAQETPTPPTPAAVAVTVGDRYPVALPPDEAVAAYAVEARVTPHGQFVTLVVFANVADVGYVQLTPCDNLAVACQPVTVRAEGVSQGDVFGLGFIEDGS